MKGFIVVFVLLSVLGAWLYAEFVCKPLPRILLGLLSIVTISFLAAGVVGAITLFNDNAYFGGATTDLIKTSLEGIDAGRQESVVQAWRELDQQYQPTYENKARYRELTEAAVQRIRADIAASTGAQREGSNSQSP